MNSEQFKNCIGALDVICAPNFQNEWVSFYEKFKTKQAANRSKNKLWRKLKLTEYSQLTRK